MLLSVTAVTHVAPKIENSIDERVRTVIEEGAFTSSAAVVDGRKVILTGAIPDQTSGDVLVESIKAIRGVRSIRSEYVVAPEMPLVVSKTADGLSFRGVVSDYRARDYLVSYAKEIYGSRNVRDATVVREGHDDLTWPNMVRTLIEQSDNFDDVEFVITGKVIAIRRAGDSSRDLVEDLRQTLESDFIIIDGTEDVDSATAICQSSLESILDRNSISFSSGTAEPSPQALAVLEEIARVLKSCPEDRFMVTGHTDASGNENNNRELSRMRAATVVRVLTSAGVHEGRLESSGLGSSEPVADNETAEGKAKNRRIEFSRLD